MKKKIGPDGKNIDPDVLKNAVLEALNTWQQNVNQALANLDARSTSLESKVADISAVLDSLRQKIETFDPSVLLARLTQVEQTQTQQAAGLLDLRAKVEDILTRISTQSGGLTPEQVRAIALDAVQDWKVQIEAVLSDLQGKDEVQAQELLSIRTALAALEQRIIHLQNIDPEQIKQSVLSDLGEWKGLIESALNALRIEFESHKTEANQRFANIDDTIQQLTARINAIPPGSDPEQVKELVLAGLAAWKADIETKNAILRNDLNQFKSEAQGTFNGISVSIDALRAQIQNLPVAPDLDTIKNAVLSQLNAWQSDIDQKIKDLLVCCEEANVRFAATDASINAILDRLNNLKEPLSADQVKALALEAIAPLKSDLDTQISQLRSDLEKVLLDKIDVDLVKQLVKNALAVLEQEWADDIAKIPALEQAIADLNARLEALPFGMTRAEVEAFVVTELLGLKNEVVLKIESGDSDLAKRIDELAIQVAAIPTIDTTIFDQKINEAIALLRTECASKWSELTANDALLSTRISALEDQIRQLPAALTPDQIRQWALEAIANWQQQVNDDLAALRAADTTMLTRIAAVELMVANLPPTIGADQIRALALEAIGIWQREVNDTLVLLKTKDGVHDSDIADLRRQIMELRTTPPGGGAPPIQIQDIVNAVLAALAAWQTALEVQIAALRAETNTKIAATLVEVTELKNWKTGIDQKIATYQTKLLEIEPQLLVLGNGLQDLRTQFSAINWAELTPDKIRDKVLEVLAAWKTSVLELYNSLETRVGGIEGKVNGWEALVAVFETRLTTLETNTTVAVIQQIVTTTLNEWKVTYVDQPLQGVQNQLDAFKEEYEQFKEEVEVCKATCMRLSEDWPVWKAAVATQFTATADSILANRAELEDDIAKLYQTIQQLGDVPAQIIVLDTRVKELEARLIHTEQNAGNEVANRLARRLLDGRGIVQGLEVCFVPKTFHIRISAGYGITSEGYIMEWSGGAFSHYRVVDVAAPPAWLANQKMLQKDPQDPQKGIYPVWELLPKRTDEKDPAIKPLTPAGGAAVEDPFIEGKIVLALRTVENERESVRFVLIVRQDLLHIIGAAATVRRLLGSHPNADDVFSELYTDADDIPYESDLYRALQPELVLNEVPLHRFGFQFPKDPEECTPLERDVPNYPPSLDLFPSDISKDKNNGIYRTYVRIIDGALKKVENEISKITELYREVLFPHSSFKEYEDGLKLMRNKWEAFKRFNERAKAAQDKRCYIQYFYGWTRDLIMGYHELRHELQVLFANVNLLDAQYGWAEHPHHLMLGPTMREVYPGTDAPLRHVFVQPPVFNGNAGRLEACRLYVRRWFTMVEQFYLPRFTDDSVVNPYAPDDAAVKWDTIRITPSKGYAHPLSVQSPAYYYPLFDAPQSLQHVWNYARVKNQTADRILNYHANDGDGDRDSYTRHADVIRPLYYVFDAYDFYRIEGHIGHGFELNANGTAPNIWNQLQEMRRMYNLDFEIIAIKGADAVHFTDKSIIYTSQGFYSPKQPILGIDHIGGVPKGGTFVLVVDETEKKIVADFALPYRLRTDWGFISTSNGSRWDMS